MPALLLLPLCSAIVSGLVYDALQGHKKFGPRIVLVVGLALNAAGYLGLWGAITGWVCRGRLGWLGRGEGRVISGFHCGADVALRPAHLRSAVSTPPLPPLCRRFTVTFWQLVGLTALASNGGTWLDTATLVTNVRA